jgi:hypothetical protein
VSGSGQDVVEFASGADGAQVRIYPDSAHGFLFQDHTAFAADVEAFPSHAGQGGSAQTS